MADYNSIYTGAQIDEGVGIALAQPSKDAAQDVEISDLKSAINDPATGLDTKAPVIIDTASGAIASFEDGADGLPLKKLVVNIEPAQSGSGDPSPENVRPISGWAECHIGVSGKNVYDADSYPITKGKYINATNGNVVDRSASACSPFIPCTDLRGVTLTLNKNLGSVQNPGVAFYSRDGGGYLSGVPKSSIPSGSPFTFTVPADAAYMRFSVNRDDTEIQLERGTQITAYEPFTGTKSNNFTFPVEVGTVYGGTIDPITGELLIDKEMFVFDGSDDEGWVIVEASANYARIDISSHGERPYIDNAIVSNMYPQGAAASRTDVINIVYQASKRRQSIFIHPSWMTNETTSSDLKAYLAEHNLQAVVTLTNPVSVPITPVEITTFLGTNIIWADTGNVSVEYRADTKLYISKRLTAVVQMLGNIETGMTASKAYAVNDFLTVNNQLYIVTAPIASGGTITPGTNVTATTVGAQLTGLVNS